MLQVLSGLAIEELSHFCLRSLVASWRSKSKKWRPKADHTIRNQTAFVWKPASSFSSLILCFCCSWLCYVVVSVACAAWQQRLSDGKTHELFFNVSPDGVRTSIRLLSSRRTAFARCSVCCRSHAWRELLGRRTWIHTVCVCVIESVRAPAKWKKVCNVSSAEGLV